MTVVPLSMMGNCVKPGRAFLRLLHFQSALSIFLFFLFFFSLFLLCSFLFFNNLPFQSKEIRSIKHNSTSLTSNKFLLFHSVQNRNANGSRKDSLASITLLAISTLPIFILIWILDSSYIKYNTNFRISQRTQLNF